MTTESNLNESRTGKEDGKEEQDDLLEAEKEHDYEDESKVTVGLIIYTVEIR